MFHNAQVQLHQYFPTSRPFDIPPGGNMKNHIPPQGNGHSLRHLVREAIASTPCSGKGNNLGGHG